ncbi:MAG: discoidin domain-containing protein, partial [Acidimicrobiales bacterium]|nr:discoidin domain-containing protein [Acidimicrobiales bacterium]
PSHPDFWDRVEQVLGSTDLRDYLDVNGGTNPALTSFEPDFDFYFEFPVDNGDYVLITERNGNSFFDLEPLDADGNVIAGSKRLGFDAPYRWNTGYAPGDNVGQPMWFTVVDVEAFEVDTTATPIAGFRIDNDGEADVKFFALSDQSFTPTCPTGFYQVLSGRLHRLDVTTGQYEVLDSGTQGSYNAMAFRESEGVFYAISTANAADGSRRNGDLIRIDPSDGSITNTGLFVQAGAFTADIDPVTGLMHISNGGNNWKVVNLDTLQIVDALTFTSGDGQSRPSVADIAIIDGRAYGMQGDRLGVYDLNTLQHFRFDVQGVTGVSGLSGGWGSTYVTSGDQFYASNNPTGAIVWITDLDTNNPQGTRISTGQPTNNNDGGSCPSAPDPFGKVNANDDFVDVYPGTASAVPVMANDTAPAGSLPRILTTDGEGTFEIRDDGVVMYTPLLSELSQTRTFEYELCPGDFESGHPRCDTATVTMNVICAPGLPIEDRPAGITGSWSELQLDMWRAQLGDSTVTAELTNLSATQAVMDQLNSNDYSQPNVAGNPALEIVHDYSQSATLTLTFSPAVVDPVVHIGRLGGYVGLGGPLAVSNSSLLTLGDGLTWTVDSVHRNGSHFSATSNTVERRVGDLMNNPTLAMDAFNRGSSGGSLEITGTVDRIVLTLESSGTALAGSLDSFEILVTEPPVTACGGEALLQGSKIANTDMASAGGEIEWSLGTTSVGTGKAENTTITDVLPTGLRAVSIRTGAWAPSTTVAEFEYLKNGNWFDIATVDGDDDATYNLPANAEAVRITYPGGLDKAFATLAPARLVTDVFDPPMDGDTPAPIVNCATWAADNMAGREVCDLVQVDLNNSIPDLTVTTLTGSAVPGEQISFKIRIENLPAASRPYREPFVAVLLPEELSYASNQPLTQDEPPQLLVTENHNGTGRTLVRWDYRNAARDLTPGEVFDLVLNTTVRPAVSASSFDLVAMTGTNNTQYNVSCVDPAIADVYDVDGDGLVAESVCWDTDSFDVDALLDVEVNASAKGRDGMDFIIYDEVPGQGASVDVAPLVTGQDTFLDAMPDASTNAAWTASVNRVSNQTPADASDCGVPLSGDAPVLSQDCANGGARWFQRSFSLGSADRPASLVLVGDVATSGVGQIFVNGVRQGQELDEFGRVYLTGPWAAGVNLIEVEVDGDGGPSLLAASLAWYRTDDGSGTGAEAINIATSGRATQSTTATAWDTGNGPPIASRAIDGNTDGDYWHESVSHTAINTGNKWWQVDLGTVVSVGSIEIWNRTDCCTTRLSGAKLFVSPDPITTKTVAGARGQAGVIEIPVTPDLSGPHHEFSVAGAAGRYVLIVLDTDEHLSLAEVQVNTHVAPAVAYTQLDSDWTVSESLDGPRRPAVSAARSCVPNWGAAPGGGSYLWGENCERPVYETTQF